MAAEHLPYVARLKKRDSDALPSEAEAVQQMLASDGWRLVTELVEEAHGEAVTRILFRHAGADGQVMEQAEYARLLGFLSGLRQARWAAESFLIRAERAQSKET